MRHYIFFCSLLIAALPLSGQDAQTAFALLREGDRHIEEEEYPEAERAFAQALTYFQQQDDCYHTAYCYLWLGEAAYGQGAFQRALELGRKAEAAADRCPGRDTISFFSMILQNNGVFYSRFGDFDRQMSYYQRAFRRILDLEGKESRRGADAYFNLGTAFGRRGQWERAIAYFDTSLAIARRLDYREGIASTYLNLSYAYGIKQDLARAIDFQRRALRLTANREEQARGYNNLGVWYGELGEHDLALRLLDSALVLRRAIYPAGHSDIFSTLLNISRVQSDAGNWGKADSVVDQAIADLRPATADRLPYLKVAYNHKAVLLQRLGREKEAERYARLARGIKSGQPDLESSSLLVLATLLLEQRRYAESLGNIQRALGLVAPGFRSKSPADNPPLRLISNTGTALDLLALKARLFQQRGAAAGSEDDLSQSLNIYLLADSLIDYARRTFQDNSSKELLAANARSIYAGAIEAGYDLYRLSNDEAYLELVFTWSEKTKSLLVLEKLHDLYAKDFYGIPASIVARERQLLQDIEFYVNQLRGYQERGAPPEEAGQAGQWEDVLFDLRQQQETLLSRMREQYPAYYSLKHDLAPASVEELDRQLLAPDEALLEYFVAEDVLYLFVLSRDRRDFLRVQLPGDLTSLVQHFRQALLGQDNRFYDYSHQLYQLLLQPAESMITGKHLIIVPDGALGYIPFEVLLKEQTPPSEYGKHWKLPYVLRQHDLRYGFSANLLLAAATAVPATDPVRVMGMAPEFTASLPGSRDSGPVLRSLQDELAPLPGSGEELDLLERRFRGRFWRGEQAQESRLRSTGPPYLLWHIATHTLINDRFPSLSTLVLAKDPDGQQDGLLHAYELYNLHIFAQLVVLSGCNTGMGAIQEGEGIASLARAFAYAGCPNLVMSLWPVKDGTTPRLMAYFYDNLAKGMEMGQALQAAKKTYLEQENELFIHPYYWGSFLYVGDRRPLYIQTKPAFNRRVGWWTGLVLFSLTGALIWCWRRRLPTS